MTLPVGEPTQARPRVPPVKSLYVKTKARQKSWWSVRECRLRKLLTSMCCSQKRGSSALPLHTLAVLFTCQQTMPASTTSNTSDR